MTLEAPTPSLARTAHGTADAGGALLVVETPPLDEVHPLNPARTAAGLALARVRGRPFQRGNTAASGRGPSLTRVTVAPDGSDERRRVGRKAASLKSRRERELRVMHGGWISTAVSVELVAWAWATAWADVFDREGDAVKAAGLREKASGHQLKAIAIAEREAASREQTTEQNPHAALVAALATDDASST